MNRLRSLIAWCWLAAGAVLVAWGIFGAVSAMEYIHFVSGALKSSIIVLVFGLAVALGSAYALRRRRGGEVVLMVASGLGLLYVAVYFLFGGLEDAGSYLFGVVILCALSVVTLGTYSERRAHAL